MSEEVTPSLPLRLERLQSEWETFLLTLLAVLLALALLA